VEGKRYMATQGLWELLNQERPDKNAFTHQDRQKYKQIHLRSTHAFTHQDRQKYKQIHLRSTHIE